METTGVEAEGPIGKGKEVTPESVIGEGEEIEDLLEKGKVGEGLDEKAKYGASGSPNEVREQPG